MKKGLILILLTIGVCYAQTPNITATIQDETTQNVSYEATDGEGIDLTTYFLEFTKGSLISNIIIEGSLESGSNDEFEKVELIEQKRTITSKAEMQGDNETVEILFKRTFFGDDNGTITLSFTYLPDQFENNFPVMWIDMKAENIRFE
jgi:hypothetical protein